MLWHNPPLYRREIQVGEGTAARLVMNKGLPTCSCPGENEGTPLPFLGSPPSAPNPLPDTPSHCTRLGTDSGAQTLVEITISR